MAFKMKKHFKNISASCLHLYIYIYINILYEIRFLIPNRKHRKGFEKIHVIRFKRAKSLKDILVKAKVAPLENMKGCCRLGEGTRCEIRKHAVTTENLVFSVLKENITLSPIT